MTTNWNSLLENPANVELLHNFAYSEMSGRELYSNFVNTELGGMVRGLLRKHGVAKAKTLTKQALRRRSSVVN
jgi:hypothetical protein